VSTQTNRQTNPTDDEEEKPNNQQNQEEERDNKKTHQKIVDFMIIRITNSVIFTLLRGDVQSIKRKIIVK